MINCNPETVSTDYDTSDRLYFEPLTLRGRRGGARQREARRDPRAVRRPDASQARARSRGRGLPDLGHLARVDRPGRGPRPLRALCSGEIGLAAPPHAEARTEEEALAAARRIGYPLVVRPSYVLGGRAMAVVFDDARLTAYMKQAVASSPEHPVLIDRFLDDAVELDVDALCDGTEHVDRRHPAAHRGGRHPLRRLVLRAPALEDPGPASRRDPAGHAPARGGPHRARSRQHPVRHPARPSLRARGQPAGFPHGAVRVEGHRRPDGARGGAADAPGASLSPP